MGEEVIAEVKKIAIEATDEMQDTYSKYSDKDNSIDTHAFIFMTNSLNLVLSKMLNKSVKGSPIDDAIIPGSREHLDEIIKYKGIGANLCLGIKQYAACHNGS